MKRVIIIIPHGGIKRGDYMSQKDNINGAENEQSEALCPCHKTKIRTQKEYKSLINRLNRIEGQVRGIIGMVERNAYCPDILIQVAAVNAALNAFNRELLSNHIHTCVAEDIRNGNDDVIDELTSVLQKLMK